MLLLVCLQFLPISKYSTSGRTRSKHGLMENPFEYQFDVSLLHIELFRRMLHFRRGLQNRFSANELQPHQSRINTYNTKQKSVTILWMDVHQK